MKKMSKLVMAAILAVALQGSAMAASKTMESLELKKYATELFVSTGTITLDNATHQLGVGVTKEWNRAIRYGLTNAVFTGTITKDNLQVGEPEGSSNSTIELVRLQPNNVVFEVKPTVALTQNGTVEFKIPAITVTNPNEPVTLTYSLYESSTPALNNSGDTMTTNAWDIISFSPAINFEINKTNRTDADVTTGYTYFKTTGTNPGKSNTKALVGTASYNVKSGYLAMDGTSATMNKFITGGKFLFTGDDISSAQDIYFGNSTTCSSIAGTTPSKKLSSTVLELAFNSTDVTDGITGYNICYEVNGTSEIKVQDFTLAATLVANGTADVDNEDAETLGSFGHDGTVLRAPFTEKSAFINLANMDKDDEAEYTVKCIGTAGTFAGLNGAKGTIPAGKTVKLWPGQLCPSTTAVNTIEFIMAVPQGQVVGSVVRQNLTTGDTGADGLVGNQVDAN